MTSANVELVRSIFSPWERGDFSSADWAHPDIELVFADPLDLGSWKGRSGMAEGWRQFLSAWDDLRSGADEYRELDGERVLVLNHFSGRGKASGVEVAEMQVKGAALFHVRDGEVTKLVLYGDRKRALADLGLARQDG
jgi:ketosteroid isomerase-like protein